MKKRYPAYFAKHNSKRGKQTILLMIPKGVGWHYITLKKLPALLRRITSKHIGDYYCLNSLYLFRTKYKLESHIKVLEKIKGFCNVVIRFEHNKVLESIQYCKSDETAFIIYADLESLVGKIDECKINPV